MGVEPGGRTRRPERVEDYYIYQTCWEMKVLKGSQTCRAQKGAKTCQLKKSNILFRNASRAGLTVLAHRPPLTHKPLPRLRWALTHPTHNPPTSPCLPRSSAQCAWATQSLEPKWLLSQTFTSYGGLTQNFWAFFEGFRFSGALSSCPVRLGDAEP